MRMCTTVWLHPGLRRCPSPPPAETAGSPFERTPQRSKPARSPSPQTQHWLSLLPLFPLPLPGPAVHAVLIPKLIYVKVGSKRHAILSERNLFAPTNPHWAA
eukprot:GGOE01011530.1.p2 GENE.GGOE01011530.1~~GGOE01011530.1.p2  ORF type:complete len:102 (-),score=1.22 GGOE01011530.1:265-570(-)